MNGMMGALAAAAAVIGGCNTLQDDPALATRPYPTELHTTNTADIQVFRNGTEIAIVNSTATSYRNVDVWVNQQYVRHVDAIPAGKTVELSLWDFHDDYGATPSAGGFFRTYEPTPVRLVELQLGEDQPMLGLVAIPAEQVQQREKTDQ
ncbi:MAG TPA: hypothetical protein VG711_07220 [Phycisphaerales bacterium]|nr:hypothetical protein [Phycisphaerales bacterium]